MASFMALFAELALVWRETSVRNEDFARVIGLTGSKAPDMG